MIRRFSKMKAFLAILSVSGIFNAVCALPAVTDAFLRDGFIGHDRNAVLTVGSATTTSASAPSSSTNSAAPPSSSHESNGADYVVIFNASHPTPPEVQDVLTQLQLSPDHPDVKYTFNNTGFKGFAASLNSHCLGLLSNMSEVSLVEQSVSISSLATQTRTQTPWGLQRISSSGDMPSTDETALTYTYTYEDPALGAGVDIYVVDTGVNVDHVVFGGRAQVGFSFEDDTTDGDGHGTHVAGTAAGALFGVASGANIWAVKVLGSDGTGSTTDTIAGIDWVMQHNAVRKAVPGYVGAIMSMSWGLSGTSDTITSVIKSASEAGIHVSVAAGNSGEDSCNFSPSNSGGANGPAIAVGSIGITDVISSFSNNGACNDVYAPGENVLSAWNTANNTINFLSGTSMACPHVTGIIAYMIAQNSTLAASPAAMKALLQTSGLPNLATGSTNSGDSKLLANNGVTAALSKRAASLDRSVAAEFELVKRGETQLRY